MNPVDDATLDPLCINTLRTLAHDRVQNANSGHPGFGDERTDTPATPALPCTHRAPVRVYRRY